MKFHFLWLVVFVVMVSASALRATSLPTGENLLPENALSSLALQGPQVTLASPQLVEITGEPFNQALRLPIRDGSTAEYSVQLVSGLSGDIRKDDVLLLSFRARCVESMTAEGQVGLVVEQNESPYQKLVERRLSFSTAWTQCFVPFQAARDLPREKSQICFRLGYDQQTIELADVRLVNFKSGVKLEDLPRTEITYAGRAMDAPWRAEARDRIEKLRKGDLAILVTNAAGQPISGAKVHARLTRHAFGFGSCVTADMLTGRGPDANRYRDIVERHFNLVVFENDMKWPALHEGIPPRLDESVKWLTDRRIEIRGHNLVWPSWRWLPQQLRAHEFNPDELRRITAEHIMSVVSHFKGKLSEWDVVNEPYSNHELIDLLGGRQIMVEWFKLAQQADPECRMYLNDYGILEGGRTNAHREHFHETIRYLIDQGAPLRGIGIQSHFSADLPPPTQLLSVLDRFSEFDLPIVSTELSLNIDDAQLQADYMRDYMTALFSHPNVRGIMLWGFWQKRHWRPQGALWSDDWALREHGKVWIDLVDKQWRTDVELTTDARGIAKLRGFLGDYEIKLDVRGQTVSSSATVGTTPGQVTLQAPQ